FDAYRFK
nr:glial hyaluronate-binding protein, GHAP=polypeptide L36-NT88 [cattle, spinal cord, Peptide Partial, 7 aa] [Bos taurus]